METGRDTKTPVIRALAPRITAALSEPRLHVIPWSFSRSNFIYALQGESRGYFLKIYTDRAAGQVPAINRFRRERDVLSKNWPLTMPCLRFSADTERVLVTDEIIGHGVQHYLDIGNAGKAARDLARWAAVFHSSAQCIPVSRTALDFVTDNVLFDTTRLTEADRHDLENYPIFNHVLTKGDMSLQNFKFPDGDVVSFDFENTGFRPAEHDLIVLIDQMSRFSRLTRRQLIEQVADAYQEIRPFRAAGQLKSALAILSKACDIRPYERVLN